MEDLTNEKEECSFLKKEPKNSCPLVHDAGMNRDSRQNASLHLSKAGVLS
jgi:hypothetical protein